MRRLLVPLVLALCAPAFGQSSVDLVEDAQDWDGKTVTFTGEAIGECMRRGAMAWIHLNDDAYMWRNIEEGQPLGGQNTGIAVWVSADIAARITWYGDYLHEGDVVEVSGVFRAASPDHGGDLMIQATDLRIVRVGHPVDHTVSPSRLIAAAILLFLTATAFVIRILAPRRRM